MSAKPGRFVGSIPALLAAVMAVLLASIALAAADLLWLLLGRRAKAKDSMPATAAASASCGLGVLGATANPPRASRQS